MELRVLMAEALAQEKVVRVEMKKEGNLQELHFQRGVGRVRETD